MHDSKEQQRKREAMKTEMTPFVPKSIIDGINKHYAKAQAGAKTAMFHAIKTGEFLLKAKAKVPHGEWINWVEKGKSDLPFSSHVRAKSYMKLAKNKELAHVVNDTDSTFNLEDINKAIAGASEEEKEEARQKRIQKIQELSQGNKELDINDRYPVIYADPPWKYNFSPTDSRKVENQYPTMELKDICELPVSELATEDAILFLWATSPKLVEALKVIKSWGFEYKTCAVWDKTTIGMGYYFRQQHELVLVATRGKIPAPEPSERVSSVVSIKKEKHSQKPVEFYSIIENMYPFFKKIELFSRGERQGWSVWGNQSNAE